MFLLVCFSFTRRRSGHLKPKSNPSSPGCAAVRLCFVSLGPWYPIRGTMAELGVALLPCWRAGWTFWTKPPQRTWRKLRSHTYFRKRACLPDHLLSTSHLRGRSELQVPCIRCSTIGDAEVDGLLPSTLKYETLSGVCQRVQRPGITGRTDECCSIAVWVLGLVRNKQSWIFTLTLLPRMRGQLGRFLIG